MFNLYQSNERSEELESQSSIGHSEWVNWLEASGKILDVTTSAFIDMLANLQNEETEISAQLTATVEQLTPAQITNAMEALLALFPGVSWDLADSRVTALQAFVPKLDEAQAVQTMNYLLQLIDEHKSDYEDHPATNPFTKAAANLYASRHHIVFSSHEQRIALFKHICDDFKKFLYDENKVEYIKALNTFMEENICGEKETFVSEISNVLCERIKIMPSPDMMSHMMENIYSIWSQTLIYLDMDQLHDLSSQVGFDLEASNHLLKHRMIDELENCIVEKSRLVLR
jgi:hypothetical protein